MRRAIGKVHVKMRDLMRGEKLGEITSIACSQFGFESGAIRFVMLGDQSLWLSSRSAGFPFPQTKNCCGRRVENWGPKFLEMFVSQAGQRRVHRPDEQIITAPFQLQHFHVAEGLRHHRIA